MAKNNQKLFLKLKKGDRDVINRMMRRGENSVRILKRVQILDLLDRKYSSNEIAPILNVTPETARKCGWRYVRLGLNAALHEKPRPGHKRTLDVQQSAQVIAIACSDPPEGFERWSISLLAKEAVKRKIVPKVGDETIRVLLHSHDCKPWREKNVVHTRPAERGVRRPDGNDSGPLSTAVQQEISSRVSR
jgi:transposase